MHALVTADTVGGVWTYARELVSGLSRRGVRVTLVSFGQIPTADQTSWLDALSNVEYRPTAFRLEWMQEAESDIEASSEYLLSIIDECKPELLHLNQYCFGALPVDLPRIVVAHSDVVSWWVSVHGHEPPPSDWINWYRETVRRGLERASAVVAPSRWMLDQVAAIYSLPRVGTVIYNGRDPNLLNPYVRKEARVLAVGRLWDSGKQVSLLTRNHYDVPVCIVGSERHPDDALRQRDSSIKFEGPKSQEQLRHLFSRASIYAATSRYEPFGLAPLEAALSRCALVANDIPTFREIWADSACYFRQNDADDLARVIRELNNDEQLRLAYANKAYLRARQLYTSKRMVDEYLTLYSKLVRAEAVAA